jgi:bacteriocin biosynthesis cyclodehydratase domain-containing protein
MDINAINIYSNNASLFLTDGDHNLIEIRGEQVTIIEQVLAGIVRQDSLDCVYSEISHLIDNDKDFFNEIVDWLVENNIVNRERNAQKKEIQVSFENLESTTAQSDFIKILNKESTNLYFKICDDKLAVNLIIYFTPIFEDYSLLIRVNDIAYQNSINILHVGIDRASFTLGPLVVPKQKTPCLRCYAKRKLTNLKNPESTLAFSKFVNKNKVHKNLVENNKHFRTVATYIASELSKFYDSGETYSSLIGKSIFFDNAIFEVTKSKILRLSTCTICQNNNHQTAFNL